MHEKPPGSLVDFYCGIINYMKKVNIVAGECLKEILLNIYKEEIFVPFNEAMIEGKIVYPLFGDSFIETRANHFKVSKEEYLEKLHSFIDLLNNINRYNEIYLWFGDEPFCNANMKIVIETLKQYQFKGKIIINIVDEKTGKIIKKI